MSCLGLFGVIEPEIYCWFDRTVKSIADVIEPLVYRVVKSIGWCDRAVKFVVRFNIYP